MKIIELPFKDEQVFKFKNKYYQFFFIEDKRCASCDLKKCTDFPIICNSHKNFRKVSKPNNKDYIEVIIEENSIFKYKNDYYRIKKISENSCTGCCFVDEDGCIGNHIKCHFLFEMIDRYNVLFGGDKNV